MKNKKSFLLKINFLVCIVFIPGFFLSAVHVAAIQISDRPLNTQIKAASTTIMFLLDDSGSMRYEFVTNENGGKFNGDQYVYGTGSNVAHKYAWKATWVGYNSLFYNPNTDYIPWASNGNGGLFPAAHKKTPRSNPMVVTDKFTLSDTFLTVAAGDESIRITNSHYYLLDDNGGGVSTSNANNGTADSGEKVYLVNIDGSDLSDIKRNIYELISSNDMVDDGELRKLTDGEIENLPDGIRPVKTKDNDLQNFANWYQYYRTRSLTAKASVGRVISQMNGLSIGLYSIHGRTNMEAKPVKLTYDNGSYADKTQDLLDELYAGTDSGATPLRSGLEKIGRYYMGDFTTIGNSPYETNVNGGSCQQVFAIAMTDGYWDSDSLSLSGGNHDGDKVPNTLADVAYYFYNTDLRSTLTDNVPTNECDTQTQQHMVTYGISFGMNGIIHTEDFDSCSFLDSSFDPPRSPEWPTHMNTEAHKIDDLFHAAVNSKGAFFTASDSTELVESIRSIFTNISARDNTGASVAVSTEELYSSANMYQGSYLSKNWTGELESYKITYDSTNKRITCAESPTWMASVELDSLTYNERKIITYNPVTKDKIKFRWADLSTLNRNLLLGLSADNNSYTQAQSTGGEDLVNYLRGQDNIKFRKRGVLKNNDNKTNKLGDIVHSSPVLIDDYLYIGANDGMLHVFDAATGLEEFAYIPSLVYKNLRYLSDKDYNHKFFIDQTPTYARVFNPDTKKYEKYILGGLGKGGKGYYCLNITDIAIKSASENGAKEMIQWEFTDSQMGFSFSKPVIVQTKSDDHPIVVIVGNGYNSQAEEGVFYIIDLFTGEKIKELFTAVFDDNGISSPIATDVNSDSVVDYVYAGDLKGNLWKLDFTSDNDNDWDFAFFDGTKPVPLFTTMNNQPITSRPEVTRHCKFHGYLVAFGTGRYLGRDDLSNSDPQAMYAVWDYGDDSDDGESLGIFSGNMAFSSKVSKHPDNSSKGILVRMLRQDPGTITGRGQDALAKCTGSDFATWEIIEDKNDPNTSNQNSTNGQLANPKKTIGWFLPMSGFKERIVQDPMILSGSLLFLSKTPVAGACTSGGFSLFYALSVCDGGSIECAWSTREKDEINMPVTIGTPGGEKLIFGKQSTSDPIDKKPPGDSIPKGILYWQEIIEHPEDH